MAADCSMSETESWDQRNKTVRYLLKCECVSSDKKGRFNIKFADAYDCPVVTYQICPEVFQGEGQ